MSNTYHPRQDSSVGYQDYLARMDGSTDDPGFDGESTVIIDRSGDSASDRRCGCGCRSQISGKRQFRQGHDARFKGILQRAHRNGCEVAIVDGGGIVSGPASTVAKNLGWEKFMTAAPARKPRKAAAKAAPAKKAAPRKSAPRKVPAKAAAKTASKRAPRKAASKPKAS